MSKFSVDLNDIQKAQKTIAEVVRPTETEKSIAASRLLGVEIFFKHEYAQYTGSFKLRGAYNKIASLSSDEKKRGVVASSAGNHAQGVALSSTKAGVKSTIVMPVTAPLIKVKATEDYGARVILHGEIYDEAYERARELEKAEGLTFVHPFEDPAIVAGQGTVGIELHQSVPDLDAVIVPVGGGGLISGVATAIKALNPKCKIYGVQSDQAPGLERLFHKQNPEVKTARATIADGLAVKKPSQKMYDHFISRLVDEMVTVTDDEIAEAIVFLLERTKAVVEGSGAAGLAAAMNCKLPLGKKTAIILCGGNIDLNMVSKVIQSGLIRKGRLVELACVVEDLPGSLNRLTKTIAEQRANVLEVHHDRVHEGLGLRHTRIVFVLETTSHEHVESIRKALQAIGVQIV